ncbi:hypothetical protein ACQZFR_18945 [Alcaligenes nematophilus]|uniref:hypothetical protein n=1 Tax=Alcaligenes nematophilus TaxID=2994643 RepID=UPI003D1E44FE
MNKYFTTIVLSLLIFNNIYGQSKTDHILYKMMPHNLKIQHAGNIGMFSIGFGYHTKNNKWKGDFMYGVVPKKYGPNKAIHSLTLKGKFAPIHRVYNDEIKVNWLNTGFLFNYSLGSDYFLTPPSHFESGYYILSTALNVGIFVGSEVKYKKWGAYYELGTTDKHIVNFAKSPKSIGLQNIWNIALGVVYHLK